MADVPPIPPSLAYGEDGEPIAFEDLDAFIDWSLGGNATASSAAQAVTLMAEAAAANDQERTDTVGDDVPEPVRRWRIEDEGAAEWAMRKVAVCDAQTSTYRDQADAWKDRIDEWLTARTRKLDTTRSFFARHLEIYAAERRERDGVKTLTLPSGRVTSRVHDKGGTVIATDQATLIAWVKENVEDDDIDLVIKFTESIVASGLKSIGRVVTQTETTVVLACEHLLTVAVPTVVGEVLACVECSTDDVVTSAVVEVVQVIETPAVVD
jgi:hypothetical protein